MKKYTQLKEEEREKQLLFDNGLEFVDHLWLRKFLKMDTYFCDKRALWQKGQVK